MITVSDVIEKILIRTPLVEKLMQKDLLNLSAYARSIASEVGQLCKKDVSEGAVLMALKRRKPNVNYKLNRAEKYVQNFQDITVRSNLIEFTFSNSNTLIQKLVKLLQKVDSKDFITISQGVSETTIITKSIYATTITNLFSKEDLIFRLEKISSLTIKLTGENVRVPGIYYMILKALAWENVNIVDIVSTTNELSIIVSDIDIERVFSIVKNL
jgi:aspartokinase